MCFVVVYGHVKDCFKISLRFVKYYFTHYFLLLRLSQPQFMRFNSFTLAVDDLLSFRFASFLVEAALLLHWDFGSDFPWQSSGKDISHHEFPSSHLPFIKSGIQVRNFHPSWVVIPQKCSVFMCVSVKVIVSNVFNVLKTLPAHPDLSFSYFYVAISCWIWAHLTVEVIV